MYLNPESMILLVPGGICLFPSGLAFPENAYSKHPRLVRRAALLGKLGRLEEIELVQRKISLLFSDPEDFREELETGTWNGKIRVNST